MNFGRILKLSTNETKNIFTIHFFYHLFIDILRLHKKINQKNSKLTKLWAGKVRRPKKKGCPDVHVFNPFSHLKQESRMNS